MNSAMKALALKYADRADRVTKKNRDDAVFYLNAADHILQVFSRQAA